jgi:hypothetical protein
VSGPGRASGTGHHHARVPLAGRQGPQRAAIDGQLQAQAIPDCRATFYPDEGHMLTIDHLDEIFAAVIAERDA